MQNKNKSQTKRSYVFLLIILIIWIIIIFPEKKKNEEIPNTEKSITEDTLQATNTTNNISGNDIQIPKTTQTLSGKLNNKETTEMLETLYTKNKNKEILIKLIKEYTKSHQFDKAQEKINSLISEGRRKDFDANTYLYIYLNSNEISAIEPQSIYKIEAIISKYQQENMLNNQDILFYKGMIKIREKKYSEAVNLFEQSKSPLHKQTMDGLHKAMLAYNPTTTIPQYYQDGLVSLALLKNGYFTFAKKISLETLKQNENYILPYQILAYTNFLTNKRETAGEYFSKLAEFDKNNEEKYQFLIGICDYRDKKYTTSILYLNQIHNKTFMTDTYRYLIKNYENINDTNKIETTRQNLLGQNDIEGSDFLNFFMLRYYTKTKTDRTNKQLGYLSITSCYERLAPNEQDICRIGDIGNQIEQGRAEESKTQLQTLAEKYHQVFLYEKLREIGGTIPTAISPTTGYDEQK